MKKKAESKILRIDNFLECKIVGRANRFVVWVEIKGNSYKAHINNTGRLEEFLIRGRKGFCLNTGKRGKTDFKLFAIEERNLGALIDTRLQMKAFEKSLEAGCLPWLAGCRLLKRNARIGASLIDYLLECESKEVYLEVKSAVLRDGDYAMYPDCPSLRGQKHIKELTDQAKKGSKAIVLFIAALPQVNAFRPNETADPKLYALLNEAKASDVDVRAIGLYFDPKDSFLHLFNPDLRINLT